MASPGFASYIKATWGVYYGVPHVAVVIKKEDKLTQFEEMVRFLDLAWPMRKTIVPCLIGPVGIGKTDAVKQHAENVGAGKVVELIASQVMPNEISGINMPDPESKLMEVYDSLRLGSLEDGDILFLDELLEADQMVLSACLTMIEGRVMMSGRKLPDIQIIAATNPTIKPAMLKPSIRQRFLFKEFFVDRSGCKDYIKERFGITLDNDILRKLTGEDNAYNILSQRSLTKMVDWIMSAGEEDEAEVANLIDSMWSMKLGSDILLCKRKSDSMSKEGLAKKALYDAMLMSPLPEGADLEVGKAFMNSSLSEMMDLVRELGIESYVNTVLEKMDEPKVEEPKLAYDDIMF